MERRSTGIALLALVALAVLFLPILHGKRVRGAVTEADVPHPGDCLIGVQALGGQGDVTLDHGEPKARLPRGTVGDCTADGAARVLSVRFGVDYPDVVKLRQVFEISTTDCVPALSALVDRQGLSQWIWRSGDRQIGIRTEFTGSTQLVAADANSPSQHWTACVLADQSGIPSAADLTSGQSAARFGQCLFRVDGGAIVDLSTVPCDLDHNVEQLGSVYLSTGKTTASDFQSACHEFAATATGMTDPTAGGLLQVEAVDDASWQGGAGSCRISVVGSTRHLSGSLLGLGAGSVPWSS